MVHYSCDHCGAALADDDPWVEVRQWRLDDEEWECDTAHFCDAEHMAAWAFALAADAR